MGWSSSGHLCALLCCSQKVFPSLSACLLSCAGQCVPPSMLLCPAPLGSSEGSSHPAAPTALPLLSPGVISAQPLGDFYTFGCFLKSSPFLKCAALRLGCACGEEGTKGRDQQDQPSERSSARRSILGWVMSQGCPGTQTPLTH